MLFSGFHASVACCFHALIVFFSVVHVVLVVFPCFKFFFYGLYKKTLENRVVISLFTFLPLLTAFILFGRVEATNLVIFKKHQNCGLRMPCWLLKSFFAKG